MKYFLCFLLLFSCSRNPGDNPPPPPEKIPTPAPPPAPSPTPTPNPPPTDPVGANDFDTWCLRAALTKGIQNYGNKDFSNFCQAGVSTQLFNKTLIPTAYTGTGTPTLTFIEPVSSDNNNTTSVFFASAIKLPITAKSYFANVAPQLGTQAYASAVAQSVGATLTSFQLVGTFSGDGPYEVQGFMTHTITTQTIIVFNVVQDSIVRIDDYKLEPGTLYLYTQVLNQGIKTIKDYRVITANIQIGADAYLLALTRLAVDNQGFSSPAETQLVQSAQGMLQLLYKLASQVPAGT